MLGADQHTLFPARVKKQLKETAHGTAGAGSGLPVEIESSAAA